MFLGLHIGLQLQLIVLPVQNYRDLAGAFSSWCERNGLILNTKKTKEIVIDFRRSEPPLQRVNIRGEDIEVVQSYRYLGVHLDSKLDWSVNTDAVYRKGQSRLVFLRRLRSLDVCGEMLHMFYQSVVASTIFYAAVCWGGSATERDTRRQDKLIWKAGSVLGGCLDSLGVVVERRMWNELSDIMDNTNHPLHLTLMEQSNSHSRQLTALRSMTERHRRAFVPTAIRLFSSSVVDRGR